MDICFFFSSYYILVNKLIVSLLHYIAALPEYPHYDTCSSGVGLITFSAMSHLNYIASEQV